MTGKFLKVCKKMLSFVLCLIMLLTTFCFFDIGSVLSDALVTVTQNDKMKGTLSSQYAYAPEIIYLAPGSTSFRYYSDYNPDNSAAIAENKTSSMLEFDYKGASSIVFAVNNVYAKESGAQVAAGNLKINGTTVSVYAGCSADSTDFVNSSATPIATSTSGSVRVSLTSGSLAGAAAGTTYIIQWVIKYVVYGQSHVTYMYTGVYAPLLEQAGTSTAQSYIANGGNPEINHAYTFITGAFRYSGGNRYTKFTGTSGGLRTAPLIRFVGIGQDSSNPTIPGGSGEYTSSDNFGTGNSTTNNVFIYGRSPNGESGKRGQNNLHYKTVYSSVPSNFSQNATGSVRLYNGNGGEIGDTDLYNSSGGGAGWGVTTGTAYIVADVSRYSNYNQIPYLSAGFVQFYHQKHGNGNKLNSITSDTRYPAGSTSGSSDTSISCSVDTSNYEGGDSNSVARGLYTLNGAITTSGLITFKFDFFNGWKAGILTESIGIRHYNALYTQVVNKGSLRTVYNAAAHSHIDKTTYGTSYSNYYNQLKTLAEKLCDPQAYTDLTTTLNVKSIEDSLVASLTVKDDYVYFVVPEAIYLTPSVATSGSYGTQYVLNQTLTLNSSTNTCTETVSQGYDTMSNGGRIYFYYKNADKVKITYSASGVSGFTASGAASSFGSWIDCSPDSITTLTVKNGSSTTYSSKYITWTATYWEDNIEKTVTAKTYLYAPFVNAVAGIAGVTCEDARFWGHRFISGGLSTAIFGIQRVVSSSTDTVYLGSSGYRNGDDDKQKGQIDQTGVYKYKLPNHSTTPAGYVGGANPTTSNLYASIDGSANASSLSGTSNYYKSSDTSGNAKSNGGTGEIVFDSSRVEKISHIPNFHVYSYLTGTSAGNGNWDDFDKYNYYARYAYGQTSQVSQSNSYTVTEYQRREGNGNDYKNKTATIASFNPNVTNISVYNGMTLVSFIQLSIKKGDGGTKDGYATAKVNFVGANRSGLRSAVEYATNYSYALQAKYFNTSSSAWTTYVSKLSQAQEALTKIDGTANYGTFDRTGTGGSGLAEELKDAVDALIGATRTISPRKNTANTATQYNVGLMPKGDGTYTIAAIGQADKESTSTIARSFYAYDKIEYTSESYVGYTYVGYIKNGAATAGSTMNAATYSSMSSTSDPLTSSSNTYLLYGNADPTDYSYTFYYLYQPKLSFDNALPIDSIVGEIGWHSEMAVDYVDDSITLKLTGSDAYTAGNYDGMKSARFPIIPGHTYRLYAEVATQGAVNAEGVQQTPRLPVSAANMYIFTFADETVSGTPIYTAYGAGTDGIINGTYTIPAGRTYATVRLGVPGSANAIGDSFTFRNIYVQDITNADGEVDDIKMAEPKSKHVAPATEVGALASTDRTGYKFKGWNTKPDGTGETYTETTVMPAKSVQLFSQWEKAQYKTEFNLNYLGSKQTNLFAPYYIGSDGRYALRSTVSAENGTVTYDYNLGEDTYTVNKTGTSTAAIFSQAQENLRLVDIGNGGQYKLKVTKISDGGSTSNASITVQPMKNGQDVGGWTSLSATAANGTVATCPTDSSLNLSDSDYLTLRIYVHGGGSAYTITNLKLKIELTKETTNSGNTPMARYTEYNTEVGALPTPTRTGYTFGGWYVSGILQTDETKVTESTLTPAQDQILYAKWTANEYTITFNANNGKMGDDTTKSFDLLYDSRKVVDDPNKDLAQVDWLDPECTGYEFAGWFDTPEEGATQVYNANGAAVESKYWNYGEKEELRTSDDGEIYVEIIKDWMYKWPSDLEVYAHWTENTFTIKFNGNNSTSGSMSDQTFAYNKAQNLTANAFKKEYTVIFDGNGGTVDGESVVTTTAAWDFNGWNNAANGSGSYNYTNSQSVTNPCGLTEQDSSATLYAQWTGGNLNLKTATRANYTFIGWALDSNAETPTYTVNQNVNFTKNMTFYAVWVETATANKRVETIDVVSGIKVTSTNLDYDAIIESTKKYVFANDETYSSLCVNYENALSNFNSSETIANATALVNARKALNDSKYSVDKYAYDAPVKNFIREFDIEYASGVTGAVEAGKYKLSDLNLNHYTTEVLSEDENSILKQVNIAEAVTSISNQNTINEAVKKIAKNFLNKKKVTTTPAYKVYENADAAMAAKDANNKNIITESITAMNYVYAGKGNYTYYCYTNSTSPTILMTVNDIAGSTGRVCYPTKAETVSLSATGSGNAVAPTFKQISVANETYLAFAEKEIGYGSTEIPTLDYYKKQTAIELQPTFTENENGTVVYKLKAYDDAYGANYATMSQLTNGNATDNALSTIPQTAETAENTITIIVNYHSGNQMNVTAEQVDPDVCLKQYHLFRTAGGATNWELPKKTGEKYSVNDPVYGQTDTGSFTYTFTLGSANDETAAVIKDTNDYISSTSLGFVINPTTTVDTTGVHISSDKNFTTLAESKMTEKQKALRTVQQALKGKFSTAKVFSGTISGGDGLGLWEWGNNWSYNYYPKSEAYTYVHIIDRWGNVYEDIFWVGKQDAKPVSSNPNSSSAGAYEILEAGGSGIDTLSLNAASMEILTDESSTLENNVYKTTGNTVKIKTGEANKSYTLTMKDKATNASTATLTSDENGIITLNVTDEAYTSGVYTFMLNDVEINLYDTVNNDKYIVKVNNGEAEEGDYAELSVVTTGEVGKVRFTDTDGNTITIASCEKNADGTKTWKMSKKRAAGEYKYSISVKVGYNWIEESSKGTLTFTAKILDSGVIRSAEYDTETGLYKITIEGRATKIQFITEDGMTRTYTRYNEFVKSKKTYDAEGNEVNDTARTLDHEIWLVDAKLYSGLKYTVAGKFEAGWNMNGTATMTAH